MANITTGANIGFHFYGLLAPQQQAQQLHIAINRPSMASFEECMVTMMPLVSWRIISWAS